MSLLDMARTLTGDRGGGRVMEVTKAPLAPNAHGCPRVHTAHCGGMSPLASDAHRCPKVHTGHGGDMGPPSIGRTQVHKGSHRSWWWHRPPSLGRTQVSKGLHRLCLSLRHICEPTSQAVNTYVVISLKKSN